MQIELQKENKLHLEFEHKIPLSHVCLHLDIDSDSVLMSPKARDLGFLSQNGRLRYIITIDEQYLI